MSAKRCLSFPTARHANYPLVSRETSLTEFNATTLQERMFCQLFLGLKKLRIAIALFIHNDELFAFKRI